LEEVASSNVYIDEGEDVILSKQGDKEAFSRLIHCYKASMYRIAKGILNNPADIEDAIGETILKAYVNLNSIKNNSSFKYWILKILINECYTIINKKKREISSEDNILMLEKYEDKYTNLDLKKAVDSLEMEQKIVILLFYYEDMTLKDIARTLNLSEGTIKSRLSRAKKRLRQVVEQ
jgi:RNA polymerase sigma factor, sigma-70 family